MMKLGKLLILAGMIPVLSSYSTASEIGQTINDFALCLHKSLAKKQVNSVSSPWSIQQALAMTYAGAAGKTRDEMSKTLGFPDQDTQLSEGLTQISKRLADFAKKGTQRVLYAQENGGSQTPFEINIANRIFAQEAYPFEQTFINFLAEDYQAPLEKMDFLKTPELSRQVINEWVAQQTKQRILDLIPPKAITEDTRMVLCNAVFLKAPWQKELQDETDFSFSVQGTDDVKVPGLSTEQRMRYMKIDSATLVAIPYAENGLQFVLMIPDEKGGLAQLESILNSQTLQSMAQAEERQVQLRFPKFKLEPESFSLAEELIKMGMPSAFDEPPGSANFTRMATKQGDEYLAISDVFHKAFFAVDKHGTEAAAATAVLMMKMSSAIQEPEETLIVKADRPFAFAIQELESGACLFIGRVSDPR